MSMVPTLVAQGVAAGVNAAFSKDGIDPGAAEATRAENLLEMAPGYDPSVEADSAEG